MQRLDERAKLCRWGCVNKPCCDPRCVVPCLLFTCYVFINTNVTHISTDCLAIDWTAEIDR